MKRRVVWGLLVCLLLVVGYFWCANNELRNQIGKKIVDGMLTREVQKVNLEAWRSLKVGLSRQEVIALLGDAPCKKRMAPDSKLPFTSEELKNWDVWQYDFCSPLISGIDGAASRAYVVMFNSDGKVSSFKEPES